MKKNLRKGFTLVELVIVIAVIAILAGVLIPTFSGVVAKAQKSALDQEAMNAFKEVYALDIADGKLYDVTQDADEQLPDGYTTPNGVTISWSVTSETAYTFSYTKDGKTSSIVNGKLQVN